MLDESFGSDNVTTRKRQAETNITNGTFIIFLLSQYKVVCHSIYIYFSTGDHMTKK